MRARISGDEVSSSARLGCFVARGKFAQYSIHEGSGGSFASALHEFDTFVEGGALGDAIEPEELIDGQAQGDENFECRVWTEAARRRWQSSAVEARAPAEDAHDEFGRQRVIGSGETFVGGRVEEVGGVGRFAFDAEEDVEGGGAGGRDGH